MKELCYFIWFWSFVLFLFGHSILPSHLVLIISPSSNSWAYINQSQVHWQILKHPLKYAVCGKISTYIRNNNSMYILEKKKEKRINCVWITSSTTDNFLLQYKLYKLQRDNLVMALDVLGILLQYLIGTTMHNYFKNNHNLSLQTSSSEPSVWILITSSHSRIT